MASPSRKTSQGSDQPPRGGPNGGAGASGLAKHRRVAPATRRRGVTLRASARPRKRPDPERRWQSMTATPLTLDGGTEVRPVDNVESANVVPLRRRQRETTRSGGAEDRIPALSALDSAAEYVLVVRSGDSLRVFSEGGLTAQDADGRELHPSHEGEELEAALPLLVGRVEDGEVL